MGADCLGLTIPEGFSGVTFAFPPFGQVITGDYLCAFELLMSGRWGLDVRYGATFCCTFCHCRAWCTAYVAY